MTVVPINTLGTRKIKPTVPMLTSGCCCTKSAFLQAYENARRKDNSAAQDVDVYHARIQLHFYTCT